MLNLTKTELDNLDRDKYLEVYNKLGQAMFTSCYIPNVGDFANAFGEQNSNSEEAYKKIEQITAFTGNTKDIINSVKRKDSKYSEEESSKFMNSVIAANVTDITESGYFWKKLMSSCDNMRINLNLVDCGSEGEVIKLPIDENIYNYKVRNHFITEFNDYTLDYNSFLSNTKNLSEIHVRNFKTCNCSTDHRTFCVRCAGKYKREKYSDFIPKYIGVYSTLMVTEHATQASLDSMNKGTSEKLNVLLEQKVDDYFSSYEEVVEKINEIIDEIGYVGVESRFYEIALLSRLYKGNSYYFAPLVTSFLRQGDTLGAFIYKPNKANFIKLISSDNIKASSLKSRIAFDIYE